VSARRPAKIVMFTTCLSSKPDHVPELLLDRASGSSIADTFTGVTEPFREYTSDETHELKGSDRKLFTDLVSELAAYNEGAIGPGHCNEDGHSAVG
jgi:hypothetical protein